MLNITLPVIRKIARMMERHKNKTLAAKEISKYYSQMNFFMQTNQQEQVIGDAIELVLGRRTAKTFRNFFGRRLFSSE